MRYAENMSELVGSTPLVKINRLNKSSNNIFAKLEYFNPLHSVKDRAGLFIIKKAMEDGKINDKCVVVEATSGNTGIALAWLSRIYGFKLIIIMPENMSIERVKILKFFGAEVILSDKRLGMEGAVKMAKDMVRNNKNYFMASQFENNQNLEAHYKTTGPEIWSDLDGSVDLLVAGVGTGGTLSGTGKYLKEKNKDLKIIAVEPSSSAVLSGKERGSHEIEGIGAGFIPPVLDRSIIDDVVAVSDEEARKFSVELAGKEGIFAGISSGAAMKAAIEVSKKFEGKNIVVILPDTAERYISSYLFEGI
ncbi:MAG: cysteine synthase A [Elusimicrobiales bacterium]|nr:cysteine synthase A [Elusimicrobiales bacterium]